jgi:hypothetical protein
MPTIGQEGSQDAGKALPSRRDPLFQLASMLGIMAGDRYEPVPFVEEFANEIDAASPTSPTVKPQPEQTMVETEEMTIPGMGGDGMPSGLPSGTPPPVPDPAE